MGVSMSSTHGICMSSELAVGLWQQLLRVRIAHDGEMHNKADDGGTERAGDNVSREDRTLAGPFPHRFMQNAEHWWYLHVRHDTKDTAVTS